MSSKAKYLKLIIYTRCFLEVPSLESDTLGSSSSSSSSKSFIPCTLLKKSAQPSCHEAFSPQKIKFCWPPIVGRCASFFPWRDAGNVNQIWVARRIRGFITRGVPQEGFWETPIGIYRVFLPKLRKRHTKTHWEDWGSQPFLESNLTLCRTFI